MEEDCCNSCSDSANKLITDEERTVLVNLLNSSCSSSSENRDNFSNTPTTGQNSHVEIDIRKPGWRKYSGILLTALSAVVFSLNALVAKLLSHYHPFNLGVWTFQLMTYISIPLIIRRQFCQKTKVFDTVWPLEKPQCRKTSLFLLLRAVCGVCALLFFFYSMKFLDVADALVIDSSSPIFVYIMAYVLLGEKCGVLPIFTTILAFIGVAFITRPPLLTGAESFDSDSLIGTALAFACMISITIMIISLKFLENVYHGLISLCLSLWGVTQCLVLSLILEVLQIPNETSEILLIIATAVLYFVGQALLTLALQVEDAGPVALVRTCEVVFAFMWQFLFLDVIPDVYSVTGAILILTGVIITVLRKWLESLPNDHPSRETYAFLLI